MPLFLKLLYVKHCSTASKPQILITWTIVYPLHYILRPHPLFLIVVTPSKITPSVYIFTSNLLRLRMHYFKPQYLSFFFLFLFSLFLKSIWLVNKQTENGKRPMMLDLLALIRNFRSWLPWVTGWGDFRVCLFLSYRHIDSVIVCNFTNKCVICFVALSDVSQL